MRRTRTAVAAVDLGASSGRVVLGRVVDGRLHVQEVHRFANEPVRLPTGLRWDLLHLFSQTLVGLGRVAREAPDLVSVGIDTWAVDYGLLDPAGELLGPVVHYRDERTDGVAAAFDSVLPRQELYEVNGLQHLPFTTMYQLLAARGSSALEAASRLLLVPDLLGCWLSGAEVTETTNASTTGLLDVRTGRWSWPLVDAVGVPRSLLAPVCLAGDRLGRLREEVTADTGLPAGVELVAVGSHDTASAVVGTPIDPTSAAYVVCGTWALVGLELEAPVLSHRSREAGFTNEAGVDGRIRFLHNVMGLWVLQECLRSWERDGQPRRLDDLLAEAAQVAPGGPVVDVDDPSLLPPGEMPDRVRDLCRATGRRLPASTAELVRCVLDSLAEAFARTVHRAAELAGREIDVVHLVGGGARNELLCRLTADACGMPVVAGPAEATAVGNLLVQARAAGAVAGSLDSLREVVRASHDLRRYEPRRADVRP